MKYTSDEEYRTALLDYFNIDSYDWELIEPKTNKLYERLKDIPEFQEKMTEAASNVLSSDLEIGLVILFSYDHFADFSDMLAKHEINV